ncbi:MAG: hypothetical protein RLY66_681 [Candidatus Parcubacteria bacterium]|jgi:hypothetical protein
MSLEYIFPDHTKHDRKVAIVIECIAAFLATGLLVWAVWYYKAEPVQEQVVQNPVSQGVVTQREAWLNESSTGTPLTQEQINARNVFVSESKASSTATRLTPEEIKARQSWVEGI